MNFKLQILLLGLAFLFACSGYVPPAGYQNQQSSGYPNQYNPYAQNGNQQNPYYQQQAPPRSDQDYRRIQEEDPDRDEVLRRSSSRRRGNRCEDETDRNHQCKQDCRTMYRRTDDKEECEELTIPQIDNLIYVHEALENPSESSLNDINWEDFEVYLNVSIAGLDRLVGEYNNRDAEEVLIWIAYDETIAEIFKDEDQDYRTLETLLSEATVSFGDDELDEPFSREIDRDDNLLEFAIGNESALEWFLDYILDTASQCDDASVSIACFTIICKIGDSFGNDRSERQNREDWLRNSSEFENYIDDIIEAEINAGSSDPQWDKTVITDVNDLDRDAYDNDFIHLCGGLT